MNKFLVILDQNNNVKYWSLILIDNKISIAYGILNGAEIEHKQVVRDGVNEGKSNYVSPIENAKNIAERKVKAKLNAGYIDLNTLNVGNRTGYELEAYLKEILPKNRTSTDDVLLPMKAQKFQLGKMNYPVIGQPKINGFRAVLRWEDEYEEGDGIFKTIKTGALFRSKNNNIYKVTHITKEMSKSFFYDIFDNELVYDGELYVPGETLNRIKKRISIKVEGKQASKPSIPPGDLSFWVFDISTPEVPQLERLQQIQDFDIYKHYDENIIANKLSSLYRGGYKINHITFVPSFFIYNDESATEFTQLCINAGFEGAIFRDMDAYYQFGKRPSTMRKAKKFLDDEFVIVDIIPKPEDPAMPIFVLMNDLNDYVFKSIPLGTRKEQREYLINKKNYIGKQATVKYYERSGANKVPYHSNVIRVRDHE